MPTALVISRHFPPLSSAGASIRLVKLMKYATRLGWQFIVLTQHPDFPVVPEEQLSGFLEKEVPVGTQVVRVPAPFATPQSQNKLPARQRSSMLWGLSLILQALRNRDIWQYDLVYAVAPVFTNAFVGALISRLTHKPLVLDLKDDWVGSPRFAQKARWKQAIESRLEAWIADCACKILVVTPKSYQLYTQRYPSYISKITIVPNGSDLDEFLSLGELIRPTRNNKFTLLSAAWGYQKDYRQAEAFLRGVAQFFKANPSALADCQVIFLGDSLSREYDGMIAELDLTSVIIRAGAVLRAELVERLWHTDLFFLVQPQGNTTAISGTLYEYWAVGHAPILLIAEEGASSELVEQHNLGQSFRHSDISGIASYIETVYLCYRNGKSITISRSGVEEFDRKRIAQQIVSLFDACIEMHA